MDVGHLAAPAPEPLEGAGDRPPGGSPAHHGQVGVGIAGCRRLRDPVGHGRHPGRPDVDHPLVVGRVVADVAAAVLLLDAADPVHQAGGAGDGPGPDQPVVALKGPEDGLAVGAGAVGLGGEGEGDGGQVLDIGDAPGLGPVGQVPVRQHYHRGAVLDGQPHRLDGGEEAVRRAASSHHRQGGLAVAAVHGQHQVGRLGLGGQPGGRPAPLDVDDHQRQLQADGQADHLGFEGQTGAGGDGDPDVAPVAGPQSGADRGDLVLGLEGAHAEVLVLGQLVEHVAGRGYRV